MDIDSIYAMLSIIIDLITVLLRAGYNICVAKLYTRTYGFENRAAY